MKLLRDADIDPAPLVGKRVAILGYGNQGRAQALNLHDSGMDVVVGLRPGSGSRIEVESAGFATASIETAVTSADIVMMLAPDEIHAALAAQRDARPQPPENPMSADRVRWEHIQRIYEMCNRNVSETARRLNMHRRTLQRILAKRAPK